jgi:sugar (pentulose or hexulose) kinase
MSHSAPDLLLGVDAGTSVVKVALFDAQGRELAVVRRRTALVSPHPAWSETDMEATWQAVAASIRTVLQESGSDPARVAAVGLTGTMVGAWLVDGDGRPVRPAILWNDGRTQPLIERMEREHPGFMQTIYRTSGSVMQQGCTLPLVRWLAENEAQTLERAAAVLCCKDWVAFKLTGTVGLDSSEAGVLPGDARARGYSDALFDLFGLGPFRRLFPPVRPSESIAGTVTEEAAAATGLRAGTPVGTGAGDVSASALGLGVVAPGDACTLLGTNILNCLVVDAPLFEPADVGLLFPAPGGVWLRAMVNVSGTTSLDWFVAQFCAAERDAATSPAELFTRLEALAQQSQPGANDVLYLPYLGDLGITAPFYEPAARAEFFGLSDRHTRADLLRAVYEGIALSIRDGYAVLPQRAQEIRLSGGGARSAFWSQMIADTVGTTVVVPTGATEYGAKGAALLAAVGVGLYVSVLDAVRATERGGARFEPRADLAGIYAERYAVYRALQGDLRRAWRMAAQGSRFQ